MPDEKQMRVIGVSRRRVDARAKVTGQTRYADDIFLPRMAYCKLLRSPHPHARIVKIDTTRAMAHPGVYAVLTGKDVPIEYGILPVSQDEQALCSDHVRHVGDPVAAVVAREELTAFEALDLIDVEYEPLRTIADPEEALASPEPRIHNYGEEGNIHKRVSLEFGNVEQSFAEADEVFEDTFFYRQYAFADRTARRGGHQGRRRQADHLEQHTNTALPSPRAGKGPADAAGPYSRHRNSERRRLRRKERSLPARDRGGQGSASVGPAGKNFPHARRSILLPPRAASRADEIQDRRKERRDDHRDAPANADRRWRLRLLRSCEHVLHRCVTDNDLSHSEISVSRLPDVHEQTALRTKTRARDGAAALRPRSTARQDCGETEHRSRRAAAAHRRILEYCDGEFSQAEHGEFERMHPARCEELRVEPKIPQVAGRAWSGAGLFRVSNGSRAADLLEQDAALRCAHQVRSGRRSGGLLRRYRNWSGIGRRACGDCGGSSGTGSVRYSLVHGRHGFGAGRSGIVFEPSDDHGGQRGAASGGTRKSHDRGSCCGKVWRGRGANLLCEQACL